MELLFKVCFVLIKIFYCTNSYGLYFKSFCDIRNVSVLLWVSDLLWRNKMGQKSVGQFVFMLHSHLPYYRKAGMWPFGEENLYECMAETYVPFIEYDFRII